MNRVHSLASLASTFLLSLAATAEVRYVSANLTTGLNTGTTWEDAYRGPDALTRALQSSTAGDTLWVSAGRYMPTVVGDRAASFVLKSGVTVLGGFSGTETSAAQRNWTTNPCVLTGDLLGNDSAWPSVTGRSENSHHVLSATQAGQSGTIDGFTISGGYANVSGTGLDSDKGGGLIVLNGQTPAVRNCRFVNNRTTFGGGAVYIRQSSPTFTDCVISANIGGAYGGACDMAYDCNPVWTRCRIEGNSAGRAGGVEVFGNSQPVFSNCLFDGNSATSATQPRGGGGLFIQQSTVTLRNCTLVNNTSAVNGAGILASNATVRVGNTILWNNRGPANATTGQQLVGGAFTAIRSLVQGGTTGTGILTADPLFASVNDFTLQAGSPALDAGDNLEAGSDPTDLAGDSRKVDDPRKVDTGFGSGPVVDIGCFERPYLCPADIAGSGAALGADGLLNNNDFILYINRFFAGDGSADIGRAGGVSGSDALFDNNDFIVFIDRFFTTCP